MIAKGGAEKGRTAATIARASVGSPSLRARARATRFARARPSPGRRRRARVPRARLARGRRTPRSAPRARSARRARLNRSRSVSLSRARASERATAAPRSAGSQRAQSAASMNARRSLVASASASASAAPALPPESSAAICAASGARPLLLEDATHERLGQRRRNGPTCVRERMVVRSSLPRSVTRTKYVLASGSSSVFNSALAAESRQLVRAPHDEHARAPFVRRKARPLEHQPPDLIDRDLLQLGAAPPQGFGGIEAAFDDDDVGMQRNLRAAPAKTSRRACTRCTFRTRRALGPPAAASRRRAPARRRTPPSPCRRRSAPRTGTRGGLCRSTARDRASAPPRPGPGSARTPCRFVASAGLRARPRSSRPAKRNRDARRSLPVVGAEMSFRSIFFRAKLRAQRGVRLAHVGQSALVSATTSGRLASSGSKLRRAPCGARV